MAKSERTTSSQKQRAFRPLKPAHSVFRRDSASVSASTATANPNRTQKFGTPANANASGYAKRIARRNKGNDASGAATSILDVYEYDGPSSGSGRKSLNRRANVGLDVDKDELVGQGSSKSKGKSRGTGDDSADDGSSGEDEGGADALRKKILANMEADVGVVDSEDDESLDSDEAFEGESDEERFGQFKFAEKKKLSKLSKSSNKVAFKDVNLDEDEDMEAPDADFESNEDGEQEDQEEEFEDEEDGPIMSLSAMLDGDAEDEDVDSESGSEAEGEEDEDQNVLAQSDQEGDGEGENALNKLDSFIDGLSTSGTSTTKKRKADGTGQDGSSSRKRRILPERTEAGAENEFATTTSAGGKLTISDLLAPLASDKSKTTSSLEKAAKVLSATSSNSKAQSQVLAAPLHTRAQERLDREAAYEATKEEVEKWAPSMRRIKEADHLSFPLQKAPIEKPSTALMTSSFQPSTEMESSIDRLLTSAGLRHETDIEKTESLEMSHLTLEEVAARRAEVRQMRELMFRADVKAKRVAKTKSKTYRKIQKRAREKNALTLTNEEMELLDPDAANEERMKMEVERARERASLRHKNTGKWARQMMGRGKDVSVDQRRELNEMLERGERLKRKVQGLNDDDDDDSDGEDGGSGGDAEDEEAGGEKIAQRAFDELASVATRQGLKVAAVGVKKYSGVMDMKFMRDAVAREEAEADAMADDFRAELVDLTAGDDEGQSGEKEKEVAVSSSLSVGGNQGRMIFRPADTQAKANSRRQPGAASISQPIIVTQPTAESDTSSVTLKSSEPSNSPIIPKKSQLISNYSAPLPATTTPVESNPWLTIGASSSSKKISRRKNEIALSKESSQSVKSQAQLRKQLGRSEDALAREAEDAAVEIDLDDVMTISKSREDSEGGAGKSAAKGKGKVSKGTAKVDAAFRNSDDEGDDVEERASGDVKTFKQRDLVALAFAGDNVVEEFNVRKQREIEAEAPKEIDTTLPGWGAWGGLGVKKHSQSKSKPKPHLIKHLPGVSPSSRADAGKAHLIISEKKDKKASKYLVKDLPHPYTSRAQFEKSLERPVGPEWNTRIAFQKGTLPRVVKKIGAVIDPVQKLF